MIEARGRVGLGGTPGGDAFHDLDRIQSSEVQSETVVGQEDAPRNPGRALVAVDKPVIRGEPKYVGRRQLDSVGMSICGKVRWTRQPGLYRSAVAYPVPATMLGELTVMDSQHDARTYPAPGTAGAGTHFASARNTSRSSCMISSASAIWRANSGS